MHLEQRHSDGDGCLEADQLAGRLKQGRLNREMREGLGGGGREGKQGEERKVGGGGAVRSLRMGWTRDGK